MNNPSIRLRFEQSEERIIDLYEQLWSLWQLVEQQKRKLAALQKRLDTGRPKSRRSKKR